MGYQHQHINHHHGNNNINGTTITEEEVVVEDYYYDDDDDDEVLAGAFFEHADESVLPTAIERSWILHTVLLPMCMISPLWWRYMQNMKQIYETRQRWPYIGNAFKYFIAAQIAMIGVFHPQTSRKSVLYYGSFVLATLYQIWWDVF